MREGKSETHTNCWTTPNGTGFMIRGKTYLTDNTKVPGGDPLLKLIAVDWFKVDRPVNKSEAGKRLPFVLVMNLQVSYVNHKKDEEEISFLMKTPPQTNMRELHVLLDKAQGKISISLDSGEYDENWQLTVGCNLPGKWVLHWGVNYVNDIGSEWDQPPVEMRPPDSITIKDYAIETPLTEADSVYEVKIDFNTKSSIAAINFVLKVYILLVLLDDIEGIHSVGFSSRSTSRHTPPRSGDCAIPIERPCLFCYTTAAKWDF